MAYTTTKFVYEILQEFAKASNRSEKINVLKTHNLWAIKDVVRGALDTSVEWNLPGGDPPYTPNRPESVPSNLLKKHRDFKYFVKGGPGDKLPAVKREKLFIDLLESIHPNDAEIVVSMINKKTPVKGLTKKIVEEAFPGLIKDKNKLIK